MRYISYADNFSIHSRLVKTRILSIVHFSVTLKKHAGKLDGHSIKTLAPILIQMFDMSLIPRDVKSVTFSTPF
jgi:hypothetical protein